MPEHLPVPLPLVVHGRPTCEDAAVVRDHLRVLGVPFAETDVDGDSSAAAAVDAVTRGPRSTPTVVFGDGALLAVEPTVEELDELLRRAGHGFEPPRATQLHGSRIDRPVNSRALPVVGRPGQVAPGRQPGAATPERGAASLSIGAFRGRLAWPCSSPTIRPVSPVPATRASWLLGPRSWPRPRGLRCSSSPAATSTRTTEGTDHRMWPGHRTWPDRRPSPGLPGRCPTPWSWPILLGHGNGPSAPSWGSTRRESPSSFSIASGHHGSSPAAGDAGGLIGSSDVAGWLRFLALECPSGAGEVDWPEPEARPPAD